LGLAPAVLMVSLPEDVINVAGRQAVLVDEVGTIRNKPPGGDKEAFEIDGRQFIARGKRNDQVTMHWRCRACRKNQSRIGGPRKCRNCAFDLIRVS